MQLIGILVTTFFLSVSGSPALQQLPSIQLKTLKGEDVDLLSYARNGKITVVSFWATWCAPCKREFDAIAEVYPDWQQKYNMELIAVTIDGARALSKVGPMVAAKGWDFEMLADADQVSQQALDYQTIPQTFVVDLDGNIVWSHNGYKPGDEKELEEVLADLSGK
jgi:cytochrome c biogenesis protein CcmG, thiol:disulfide interchange protein DsbE